MENHYGKGNAIMNKDAKKQLTLKEKMACNVLSHLRYNDCDEFYKCTYNDYLLTIASTLLGGRDPVEFICWLCDEDLDNPAIKNLK